MSSFANAYIKSHEHEDADYTATSSASHKVFFDPNPAREGHARPGFPLLDRARIQQRVRLPSIPSHAPTIRGAKIARSSRRSPSAPTPGSSSQRPAIPSSAKRRRQASQQSRIASSPHPLRMPTAAPMAIRCRSISAASHGQLSRLRQYPSAKNLRAVHR